MDPPSLAPPPSSGVAPVASTPSSDTSTSSPAVPSAPSFVDVTFTAVAHTHPGEVLFVVGDVPEFAGLRLESSRELFPLHKTITPVSLRQGTQPSFKFALHSNGKLVKWITPSVCVSGGKKRTGDGEDAWRVPISAAPGSASKEMTIDTDLSIALPPASALSKGSLKIQTSTSSNTTTKRVTLNIEKPAMTQTEPVVSAPPFAFKEGTTIDTSDQNVSLPNAILNPSTDNVIIVCFYLPLRLERRPFNKWVVTYDDEALLSRKLPSGSPLDRTRTRFVGICPCDSDPPSTEQEKDDVRELLIKMNMVPVFVDPVMQRHASVYCNETLHNILNGFVDVYGRVPTKWWNPTMQSSAYNAYISVGKELAQMAQSVAHERTIVWVHGYDCIPALTFLMPKHAHITRVGLSLHRPFPSSEILRTLSVCRDLLRAMLSANVITFHLYEYVRHFTTCCRRILGIDEEIFGEGFVRLRVDGRRVHVVPLHGGLDPKAAQRVYDTPERVERTAKWLSLGKDSLATPTQVPRILIAGLDYGGKLDGVKSKLAAYERMLDLHPEWASKVSLIQIVVQGVWPGPGGFLKPSADDRVAQFMREAEDGLADESPDEDEENSPQQSQPPTPSSIAPPSAWHETQCREICARIETKHGRGVVRLETRSEFPSLLERLSLFAAADVLLQTPLREGISLLPYEFCIASAQTHGYDGADPSTHRASYLARSVSHVAPSDTAAASSPGVPRQRSGSSSGVGASASTSPKHQLAGASASSYSSSSGAGLPSAKSLPVASSAYSSSSSKQVQAQHEGTFASFASSSSSSSKQTQQQQEGVSSASASSSSSKQAQQQEGVSAASASPSRNTQEPSSLSKQTHTHGHPYSAASSKLHASSSSPHSSPSDPTSPSTTNKASSKHRSSSSKRATSSSHNPALPLRSPNTQAPVPVMVLSEFSSHVAVLAGAIRVNPWQVDSIVQALVMALEMGHEEREARFVADLNIVRQRTATKWAEHIVTIIKRCAMAAFDPRPLDSLDPSSSNSSEAVRNLLVNQAGVAEGLAMGLGLNRRMIHSSTTRLDLAKVVDAFSSAKRALVLLDYGGTIVSDDFAKDESAFYAFSAQGAPPLVVGDEMLFVLDKLAKGYTRSKTDVYILSGRTRSELDKAFSNVPNVGLVAEHGYYLRRGGGVWQRAHFGSTIERDWMETAVQLMKVYAERTYGTYVERKESMVLWQYRDADPEFGESQAKELKFHLSGVLEDFSVEVVHGKGYVEVRPEGCDKGSTAKTLIQEAEASGAPYDFVLCMGDDAGDEPAFRYLNLLRKSNKVEKVFSVVVGQQPVTSAMYTVNEVSDVLDVMRTLNKASSRFGVRGSVIDGIDRLREEGDESSDLLDDDEEDETEEDDADFFPDDEEDEEEADESSETTALFSDEVSSSVRSRLTKRVSSSAPVLPSVPSDQAIASAGAQGATHHQQQQALPLQRTPLGGLRRIGERKKSSTNSADRLQQRGRDRPPSF